MSQVMRLCLMCLMEFFVIFGCELDSCANQEIDERNRVERALLFPPSSTIGLLAALALPLDDRKNVFLSYNFEANYNSPFLASQYIPGPLTRLDLVRSFGSANSTPETNQSESQQNDEASTSNKTTLHSTVTRRSLVTRTNLYKSIERKLNAAGYNGHDCLLRAICEAAEIPLGMHNGVLGDMMHIIFTPSSSDKENVLYDFYDAEAHGTMSMCKHYSKHCPESLFDWISVFE